MRTFPVGPMVGVIALALLLGACTDDAEATVQTGEVGRATVVEIVEAPASVTARASASLTAVADGSVSEVAVKDGQQVAKGDVLLVIDSPNAEAALDAARRADAQAADAGQIPQPELDLGIGEQADDAATAAFAAARQAAAAIPDPAAKATALAQIAQAEAQYAAARARGEAAAAQLQSGLDALAGTASSLAGAQRVQTRAAVAAAEATVEALTVTAPIAGIVTLGGAPSSGSDLSSLTDSLPSSLAGAASLLGGGGGGASTTGQLSVGSPVQSGDTVASVVDAGTLSLSATVDETDVLLVKPGIPAEVEIDAVPGARYSATVQSVATESAGTGGGGVGFGVRLSLGGGTDEFGDPAPAPRPGMSAVARLQVRKSEDVLAVPVAAVFRDGGVDSVWVVEAGVAEKRAVRLGAQGEDTLEILEGLTEGTVIVTSGADQVTEGQSIP